MTGERDTIIGAGRGFVHDLTASARENPVSAALIGMGVLWMLVGKKNVSLFGAQIPAVAKSAGQAAASAVETGVRGVGSKISDSVAGVATATNRVADAVANRTRDVGASLGEVQDVAESTLQKAEDSLLQTVHSINSAVRSSAASGREYATSLQATLSDSFERQPLLLGAIGVAIGAGIASSFSATTAEKQFMGETATSAKDSIVGLAAETAEVVSSTAKKTIKDMKEEATRQGFTADAASAGIAGIADKVKNLSDAVESSVKIRALEN